MKRDQLLGRRAWRTAALAFVCLLRASASAQFGDSPQDGATEGPSLAMGSARMVRGTVSAVAGDRISVKSEDGEVFQVQLTPNTRLLRDRNPARAADIRVGDGVGAGGEIDPATKTLHALFLTAIDAEQVKKIRDSLGKTWIQGKITAIDELKLTILRGDKVTQVIAVDEDTSFKRGTRGMALAMRGNGSVPMSEAGVQNGGTQGHAGGESITLADVKVGDLVAGEGALKSGVFVPTTLAVMDPSQRRHRGGEGGAPANSGTGPKE